MGLYTKIDKQIDNKYTVVSMNKSLSRQNFYWNFLLILLLFNFNVIVIFKKLILSSSH